ncbi:hypothetical protein [Arthrobacter sp. HLT1-21]
MTENIQDRPAALPARRRPQPAPDETVDPVDYSPAAQAVAAPAAAAGTTRTRRKRELTFPFSTRISQDVQELLDAAVEAEGITVREAVEQAIRTRWGK